MKIFMIVISILILSYGFWKIGDKHGYEDGFKQGYALDCHAEIDDLSRLYRSLSKQVSFQDDLSKNLTRKNDSLTYMLNRSDSTVPFDSHMVRLQDDARRIFKAYLDSVAR